MHERRWIRNFGSFYRWWFDKPVINFSNILAVRKFIKEADEDGDSCLNINEFIAVFKKVASGKLDDSSSLWALAQLTEIDVSEVKVSGAVTFFEAQARKLSDAGFAQRMEEENRRKQAEAEEKQRAKARFAEKKAQFEQSWVSYYKFLQMWIEVNFSNNPFLCFKMLITSSYYIMSTLKVLTNFVIPVKRQMILIEIFVILEVWLH